MRTIQPNVEGICCSSLEYFPALDGDGNAVVTIGEAAFRAKTTITSVMFPGTLNTVDALA